MSICHYNENVRHPVPPWMIWKAETCALLVYWARTQQPRPVPFLSTGRGPHSRDLCPPCLLAEDLHSQPRPVPSLSTGRGPALTTKTCTLLVYWPKTCTHNQDLCPPSLLADLHSHPRPVPSLSTGRRPALTLKTCALPVYWPRTCTHLLWALVPVAEPVAPALHRARPWVLSHSLQQPLTLLL